MTSLSALTAFDDNYIWVLTSDKGQAVIVDPGDAAPVLAAADDGLRPAAILLTHHHDDHIGGVAGLLAQWPDLPVISADARASPPPATRWLTARRSRWPG